MEFTTICYDDNAVSFFGQKQTYLYRYKKKIKTNSSQSRSSIDYVNPTRLLQQQFSLTNSFHSHL